MLIGASISAAREYHLKTEEKTEERGDVEQGHGTKSIEFEITKREWTGKGAREAEEFGIAKIDEEGERERGETMEERREVNQGHWTRRMER